MAGRSGRSRLEARRERLERHAAEEDPQVVLAAAGRFLEARQRSVAEVRRHLAKAGYPAELVDQALARLQELGMLDDRAFAGAWVESRDRAHPRGESALRRELALKGIDRETVAAVLADRAAGRPEAEWPRPGGGRLDAAEGPDADESPDLRAALALLARRRAALARVTDPRLRRQRAYALLARNGFDPEVCRTAATRVMEAGLDAEDGIAPDD